MNMNQTQTNPKKTLSVLWIFLTLNFIFCDVFTLMYSEELQQILSGKMGETVIDQPFLLVFAFLMEIPMAMILLSRFLPYRLNRWLNIVAGVLLTFVQVGSLFVGKPTLHYVFFSLIETAAASFIVWLALRWKNEETAQ
jgi:hypothetical protein